MQLFSFFFLFISVDYSCYKLKNPVYTATHITSHIMRIVTRAVGVFLVLTIQEVVCRQHEPDLVSPFHGKFKSSVEPEEMVRRGSIRDKIRVRIKPPLFCGETVPDVQTQPEMRFRLVYPRKFMAETEGGNIRKIITLCPFVCPYKGDDGMVVP